VTGQLPEAQAVLQPRTMSRALCFSALTEGVAVLASIFRYTNIGTDQGGADE
jgi:hypothetical protein